MKKLLVFIFIVSVFSCTKEAVNNTDTPAPSTVEKVITEDTVNANLLNVHSPDADNGVNIYTNDAGYSIFKCWIYDELKPRLSVQGNGTLVFSDGTTNQSYIYNAAGAELTLASIGSVSIQTQRINFFGGINEYSGNADAKTNGLISGDLYRTGDVLKIVHD